MKVFINRTRSGVDATGEYDPDTKECIVKKDPKYLRRLHIPRNLEERIL